MKKHSLKVRKSVGLSLKDMELVVRLRREGYRVDGTKKSRLFNLNKIMLELNT